MPSGLKKLVVISTIYRVKKESGGKIYCLIYTYAYIYICLKFSYC